MGLTSENCGHHRLASWSLPDNFHSVWLSTFISSLFVALHSYHFLLLSF